MSKKYYDTLSIEGKSFLYCPLRSLEKSGFKQLARLPFSLKILLENLLRFPDDKTELCIAAMEEWIEKRHSTQEMNYRPARVLMQDFTGVPAIVDLAAMRDAMKALGKDPRSVNPQIPVDLVIDHSVQVDRFASLGAFGENVHLEMERNQERYTFLRWGQAAFQNFRVVPPGTGICHQVNLEYLAKVVWEGQKEGEAWLYPDTLVGTDSHTTMINGLGVLGWGVGGIEAEAAMLGQPISMLIPEVIGVKLIGALREGVLATDLVLTLTEMLRKRGVVGKFVEYFGPGLDHLPLADRATIANMAPEYGATCGFFPVDKETLRYLQLSGRPEALLKQVEQYAKVQGLWRDTQTPDPVFTDVLELDLSQVEASLAGPRRPQDRVPLSAMQETVQAQLPQFLKKDQSMEQSVPVADSNYQLKHADLVIAAITSCTNTSNPTVLIAAGLLAKKAVEKGLSRKAWVKTSLAPGSKVVTEYLKKAGLQEYLDKLGFNLVGYGCTTCIGNSGPLEPAVEKAIAENDLAVSAVLSGNRNFEGRIHPLVKMNWLASPPLVVAYALAGTTRINLQKDPIAYDSHQKPIYLRDIWPSNQEVAAVADVVLSHQLFQTEYQDVFTGDADWQALPADNAETYAWSNKSTYIQNPPYFSGMTKALPKLQPLESAHILALFGDSITTDHISPAGSIKADSPAGEYLQAHHVAVKDFNSYGSRRGNHEVMMRGTFANIRIRNAILPGSEGGVTKYIPTGETMSIYDAAMRYQEKHIPLVVIAGKEYGTGSSRDWAAKGTLLLGVRAVIAESFERIHRSNLIGMGVIPFCFTEGLNYSRLGLSGEETISIEGIETVGVAAKCFAQITYPNGRTERIALLARIDTDEELAYIRNGGILHYVLRNLSK